VNIWLRCRDANGTVAWPDGEPYVDQPLRLIHSFDIVAREWARYDKKA